MNELSGGGAESPAGVAVTDETDEMFESRWVRVSELIGPDGTPVLVLTHCELMSPWDVTSLLMAASDFNRTVVTNIFYGQTFEDMTSTDCIDGTCDCEDADEGDDIWGAP